MIHLLGWALAACNVLWIVEAIFRNPYGTAARILDNIGAVCLVVDVILVALGYFGALKVIPGPPSGMAPATWVGNLVVFGFGPAGLVRWGRAGMHRLRERRGA